MSSSSASMKDLGFENLFEGPILLAKLLELRWFTDATTHFKVDAVGAIINDDNNSSSSENDEFPVQITRPTPLITNTATLSKTKTKTKTRPTTLNVRRSLRYPPAIVHSSSITTSDDDETETELSSADEVAVYRKRKDTRSGKGLKHQSTIQDSSGEEEKELAKEPEVIRLSKMPFLRRNLSYIRPPSSSPLRPSSPPRKSRQPKPKPIPSPQPIKTSPKLITTSTPVRRSHRYSTIDLLGIVAGDSFTITDRKGDGGTGGFDLVRKIWGLSGVEMRATRSGRKRNRTTTKTSTKKKTTRAHTPSTKKTPTSNLDRKLFPNHTKLSILPPKLRRRSPNNERRRVTETKVFYHYVTRGGGDGDIDGDEIRVQVEERLDRRCPFCFFNAVTDAGILKHCNSTHGCELTFEGGRDEKGDLHIAVKPNPIHRWSFLSSSKIQTTSTHENLVNYCYISSKRRNAPTKNETTTTNSSSSSTNNDLDDAIPFIKKPLHETAFLDPILRRRKIRKHKGAMRDIDPDIEIDSDTNNTDNENDNNNDKPSRGKSPSSLETAEVMRKVHAEAISQYVLTGKEPIRQYYHSRTNLPMADGEWDYDSDDDTIDDAWIHQLSEKLIDEFGDVSPKEKILMKLWNRFIRSHTIIADGAIPKRCMDFIVAHHNAFITGELRAQLLAHFMNLWDNRLLSSSHIYRLMKRYDTFVEGS